MSNEQATSSKATIIFATLAALGLGALIGVSLSGDTTQSDADQTAAASNAAAPVATNGAPVYRFIDPMTATVKMDDFGTALPVTDGENFTPNNSEMKTETVTITIEGDGGVEYKALMDQGDVIVFSWKTDGGQAYYDFHAHQDTGNPEFFTRYDEGEGVGSSGSILAAYDGQHGWYWLNLEADPITITLEVAGDFNEIVEIDLGGY